MENFIRSKYLDKMWVNPNMIPPSEMNTDDMDLLWREEVAKEISACESDIPECSINFGDVLCQLDEVGRREGDSISSQKKGNNTQLEVFSICSSSLARECEALLCEGSHELDNFLSESQADSSCRENCCPGFALSLEEAIENTQSKVPSNDGSNNPCLQGAPDRPLFEFCLPNSHVDYEHSLQFEETRARSGRCSVKSSDVNFERMFFWQIPLTAQHESYADSDDGEAILGRFLSEGNSSDISPLQNLQSEPPPDGEVPSDVLKEVEVSANESCCQTDGQREFVCPILPGDPEPTRESGDSLEPFWPEACEFQEWISNE
jgi:hypothetical protein